MGLGQQGQARDSLGFELVGDQVEQGGASPFSCFGNGGPEKVFVVELAGVAVVELENAVLTHHVLRDRSSAAGSFQLSASGIGVQTGGVCH